MATFLGYSNFNGKNGDKFSADLLYDIIEKNEGGNYYIIRLYGYIRSWGYSGSGSYCTFYINGENAGGFSSITANQYSEVARRDVRVDGDAEGNCVLYWSLSVDTSWTLGDASASGSLTLDKIPRKSSVGCTDGNIESTVAISINRASDTFTHTLRYQFGSLSGTIATGVGTSYGWTLPTDLYSQIPNNPSGVGTITCETWNGGNLIGTSYANFTAFVDEGQNRPTVSLTVIDTNKTLPTGYTTKGLTGSEYKFIKGVSNAQVTVSASAKNSASIVSYRTVNNSNIYSSNNFIIENIEDATFDISATDSRGFPGYQNGNPTVINMVNYVPLTVNHNIYRPEPTSGEVVLSVSGNYFSGSFGNQNNSLEIKYRYKESSASWDGVAYKTITATIDSANSKYSVSLSLGKTFDYQKSYDFEVVGTDKIKSIPKTYRVAEGIPMFAMFKDHLEAFGSELVNNKNGFVSIGANIAVNIHSEEEHIVGIWRDGRPIYEKTIYTTTPSTAQTWTAISPVIPDIQQVISLTGTINGYLPVPMYITPDYYTALQYSSTDGIMCLVNGYTNAGIIVMINYLKSTD